jgi:hypothetical protein
MGVWTTSLDLIFLKDFLKLFVNMHLKISLVEVQIFHNFGPMDQKLWRNNKFRRSGLASAGAN